MHNRTADCCSAITTSTAINIDQQKPLFAPHAICRQKEASLKCNGQGDQTLQSFQVGDDIFLSI